MRKKVSGLAAGGKGCTYYPKILFCGEVKEVIHGKGAII